MDPSLDIGWYRRTEELIRKISLVAEGALAAEAQRQFGEASDYVAQLQATVTLLEAELNHHRRGTGNKERAGGAARIALSAMAALGSIAGGGSAVYSLVLKTHPAVVVYVEQDCGIVLESGERTFGLNSSAVHASAKASVTLNAPLGTVRVEGSSPGDPPAAARRAGGGFGRSGFGRSTLGGRVLADGAAAEDSLSRNIPTSRSLADGAAAEDSLSR